MTNSVFRIVQCIPDEGRAHGFVQKDGHASCQYLSDQYVLGRFDYKSGMHCIQAFLAQKKIVLTYIGGREVLHMVWRQN